MTTDSSIWSKDTLEKAIKQSFSISETLRRLGLTPQGNFRTFHKYCKIYRIDISHFLGKRFLLGSKRNLRKIPLEQVLVPDSFYAPKNLKIRLIQDGYFDYKCNECGLVEWRGKELNLHLDHINGDKFDNRIENLRLLCPNCHSQTDTFCIKNVAKTTPISKYVNCKCGRPKLYSSNSCKICAAQTHHRPTKIVWPHNDELALLVHKIPKTQLGKALGVSDNAVRKHVNKQFEMNENFESLPNYFSCIAAEEFLFHVKEHDGYEYVGINVPHVVAGYDSFGDEQILKKKDENYFQKFDLSKYDVVPFWTNPYSLPVYVNNRYFKGLNPNNPKIGDEIKLYYRVYLK